MVLDVVQFENVVVVVQDLKEPTSPPILTQLPHVVELEDEHLVSVEV